VILLKSISAARSLDAMAVTARHADRIKWLTFFHSGRTHASLLRHVATLQARLHACAMMDGQEMASHAVTLTSVLLIPTIAILRRRAPTLWVALRVLAMSATPEMASRAVMWMNAH
jgi:hypothetical protein